MISMQFIFFEAIFLMQAILQSTIHSSGKSNMIKVHFFVKSVKANNVMYKGPSVEKFESKDLLSCIKTCNERNCLVVLYNRVQRHCFMFFTAVEDSDGTPRLGMTRWNVKMITKTNASQHNENFDCSNIDERKEDTAVISSSNCTQRGKKKPGRSPKATEVRHLRQACKEGNLSEVKRLVCGGLVDINYQWKIDGATPVMIASKHNKTYIFDFMVQNGCDLSAKDVNKSSVLHYACASGALGIVRKLLDNNHIDIECNDKFFLTPLMYAVKQGKKYVVQLLKCKGADMDAEAGCKYNILHFAIMGGKVDMVKYVLSLSGFDIETKDCYGRTPLNLAVHHGHLKVVKFLIKHKADITTVDNSGYNVLHTACKTGELAIVKYLITFEELKGFETKRSVSQFRPIDLASRYSKIVSFLQSRFSLKEPILFKS